jgi:hypothetical protein
MARIQKIMHGKIKTSAQKSTQKNGRTLPICSNTRGSEPAPVRRPEAGQSGTPGRDRASASRIIASWPVAAIRLGTVKSLADHADTKGNSLMLCFTHAAMVSDQRSDCG